MYYIGLFFFVSLGAAVALPQSTYTTKFDNVNIDQILRNDRLLNNYFKCLMDQGSCSPDAAELKGNLREALETMCQKCSVKQREGTEKVLRYLIERKPREFAALEKKYDPKGIYRARFTVEAERRGIKI